MKRSIAIISAMALSYALFGSKSHAMFRFPGEDWNEGRQPETNRYPLSQEYNACMEKADSAFAIRCQQCEKWFHGPDASQSAMFHQCIFKAEKNLIDRQASCERVEIVHESLNPNINVNLGLPKPSAEPSKEIKNFMGNILRKRNQ